MSVTLMVFTPVRSLIAVGWVDGCYPALFFSINTDQERDLTQNTSIYRYLLESDNFNRASQFLKTVRAYFVDWVKVRKTNTLKIKMRCSKIMF
jgi:hypothetical protein